MEDYINKADAFICNENSGRIFCMQLQHLDLFYKVKVTFKVSKRRFYINIKKEQL